MQTSNIETSKIAKKYGFTHVAHYTTMQNDKGQNLFGLISQVGSILTPAVSKQSNFEFDEYNNEHQVFLGLVDEKMLGALKQYGSIVMLFDLTLLDKSESYFINSVFTGRYNPETSTYPTDPAEHREKIISQIQQNGNRNEVVFQKAIALDVSPLVRIALLGGKAEDRKAMILRLVNYYTKIYAEHKMQLVANGEVIDVTHL